jgi:hypothetical protein
VVAPLVSCYRSNVKPDKPKSLPGPLRDELVVGLARHDKPKQGQLQRWLIEFGGWVFTGLLLVVVLVSMYGVSGRKSEKVISAEQLASLTVVGPPKKVWDDGSTTKVKSVQVRVGNQGPSRADDVRVVVALAGVRLQLAGPIQIDSGKSELFAGKVDALLRPGQDLQVILECANCRQDGPVGSR